jgi:hypothetical protein
MDEKTLELLTHLKDVAKTRIEFAQKNRQMLHSLLLLIDKKDALNTSGVGEVELRVATGMAELSQP